MLSPLAILVSTDVASFFGDTFIVRADYAVSVNEA